MPQNTKTKLKIERYLYKKGFTEEPLRAVIMALLVLLAVSLLLGLGLLPVTRWMLVFFAGVAIFCFNFWFMSLYLLARLSGANAGVLLKGQLARFFGRMLFTGLALALVLILGGSPLALGLGFTSGLVLTSIVALARYTGRKS